MTVDNIRYLKLASATDPNNDFIELNDLNGFLCTSFQPIGINRKLDFLEIENMRFSVSNKPEFKEYRLIVEILTKYSEYEVKHRELITFLDRNKKGGFRLYYRPYKDMEIRYCLCDIKSSVKTEKLQPVVISVEQNSLWFGEEKSTITSQYEEEISNIFAFEEDSNVSDYYCTGFRLDSVISGYYCIVFYSGAQTRATIINNSYNEIPLNIRIYGNCVNPTVSLFRKGGQTPIKQLQVLATINENYYVDINASILNNGIWYVNNETQVKTSYDNLINNDMGSPYFYIDNGEYYISVIDEGMNMCYCEVVWQEEYNE